MAIQFQLEVRIVLLPSNKIPGKSETISLIHFKVCQFLRDRGVEESVLLQLKSEKVSNLQSSVINPRLFVYLGRCLLIQRYFFTVNHYTGYVNLNNCY